MNRCDECEDGKMLVSDCQCFTCGRLGEDLKNSQRGELTDEEVKEMLIKLWLKAEEKNMDGDGEEAYEMKMRFSEVFEELNKELQDDISDYLDSVGG